MPRDIFLVTTNLYYALKWPPPPLNGPRRPREPNAGVISFSQRNFQGICYVNSKAIYERVEDLTLAQELAAQGFNFLADGFHEAPVEANGRRPVMGQGGGCSYLGYRTFENLDGAIAYLNANGLVVVADNAVP